MPHQDSAALQQLPQDVSVLPRCEARVSERFGQLFFVQSREPDMVLRKNQSKSMKVADFMDTVFAQHAPLYLDLETVPPNFPFPIRAHEFGPPPAAPGVPVGFLANRVFSTFSEDAVSAYKCAVDTKASSEIHGQLGLQNLVALRARDHGNHVLGL
jgi:hypothetical protein